MPRILVVDDEPIPRARLADVVRKLGYDVLTASSARAEVELGRPGDIAAVLCSVRLHGVDPVVLAGRLHERGGASVILTGVVNGAEVAGNALRQRVTLAGVLAAAADSDAVSRMLLPIAAGPLPVEEGPGDDWSGEDFLRGVEGSPRRFPLARVLYLAGRVAATGTMVVEDGGDSVIVAVRAGRVLYVSGVPGLVRGPGDRRDLVADIGTAVAAGRPPEAVFDEATANLGMWAAASLGSERGVVRWETSLQAPRGAFPLPTPLPRMIVRGLEAARPPGLVEGEWTRRALSTVSVRIPHDSPEGRWGLDARALRVIRALAGATSLVDVFSVAGAARGEVLRAVDTLYCLGILLVGSPAPEAVVQVDQAEGDALRERLAAWEGARASAVLGVEGMAPLTPKKVDDAYRTLAAEVHPDQAFGQAPAIRALREACFARLNAARDRLRDPILLEEENRFLDARAKGIPYVTDADRQAARALYRKGDGLFRGRSWAEADAVLSEAAALDPVTWPHVLAAARAGWLSHRLTPDAAMEIIAALRPKRPSEQAEALVALGRILQVAGRTDEAAARFRKAAELDPDNRDAQRELRLAARRAGGGAAPAGAGAGGAESLLGGLLRRRTEPPAGE